MYLQVYTECLSAGTEVYIDNVHINASVKSKYAAMDGIVQDMMDNHVHRSQLIGFPIADDIVYYGVDAIEGCNSEFIELTTYGYNGHYGKSVSETKRYIEQQYLDLGVYANKIQVVYDLLVKGQNDKYFSNVSVKSDFLVPVTVKLKTNTNEVEEENYQKIK